MLKFELQGWPLKTKNNIQKNKLIKKKSKTRYTVNLLFYCLNNSCQAEAIDSGMNDSEGYLAYKVFNVFGAHFFEVMEFGFSRELDWDLIQDIHIH